MRSRDAVLHAVDFMVGDRFRMNPKFPPYFLETDTEFGFFEVEFVMLRQSSRFMISFCPDQEATARNIGPFWKWLRFIPLGHGSRPFPGRDDSTSAPNFFWIVGVAN